ncbi:S41 family peptidase [Nitrosomonas sp.]|uniref:S41 family peptidase n=1 Tax=Nitrosomonas sp. TaxID=42353 RepID=UPI0025F94B90|nr:S41 family peptidase [Nitrosomonas sp.]
MIQHNYSRKSVSNKARFRGKQSKWFLGMIMFVMIATMSFLLWNGEFLSNPAIKKQPAYPANDFWLKNDDLLLFLETITQIKNHDLFLNPEIKRRELIQNALRSFVEKLDPFAAYMTADEFTQWKKSQSDRYVGIGMEIVKDPQGQVICLPYSDSPAAKAGIQAGDRLISIEGESVSGRSILAIGSMARGAHGTSAKLLIMASTMEQKLVSVKRSHVSFDSVSKSQIENIDVIKIPAFTSDTKKKLANALADFDKTKPLIIDLRGNAGGDLPAAIDSAMLFLAAHNKIVSIKTRQSIKKYESSNSVINSSFPLFIWQDKGTASAAEVFIAALTNNHRAISIGKKSFGKGTKQEILEMSDGSALFMTTGFLQTPNGLFFDGKGLNPDYTVESNNPKTTEYLAKVKELLRETSGDFSASKPEKSGCIEQPWLCHLTDGSVF